MPGQSFDALYYPYMHFWDVGWLKSTALYWDSISRVVPSGFDPKDPDEVKYLVDKGYINDTWRSPDKQDIHFVTEAMGRLVAAHGRELRARYGLQNRASWTATDPNVSSLQWVQAGWEVDDKLGYVYQDKCEPPLLKALIEVGLAERPWTNDETGIEGFGWFGVHPKLEEAYLWALASETARTRGLRLVADNPRHHTTIMGDVDKALRDFLLGPDQVAAAPAGASPNLDAVMMTVVLRNVRPRDYNELPASEIVRLRQETAEARTALQLELQNLVFDKAGYLQGIRDAGMLERRLGDLYDKHLKSSLDKMEKATQTRYRVDWKGTLAATFLAPATIVAAFVPHLLPLLVASAGGRLVVGLWQAHTSRAELGKRDPVAFYLHQIADMKETAVADAVAASGRTWRHRSPSSSRTAR